MPNPCPAHCRDLRDGCVVARSAARITELLCVLWQSSSYVRVLHLGTLALVLRASAPESETEFELECVRAPDQLFLSTYSFSMPSSYGSLRRQNSKEKPSALVAHAGICAGGVG
ncbi:protein of unknown function [uncultured Woeseiaceae bacterium]|uniref:Uncharacterized protein n=1 Tax=uncultured Woeseiaceae bacterium TaxID=1983305 RepID=A0A7D9H5M4_9GAMM|nr:protein of unknown function [uncultured Woeseiaceae bacterium]